MTEAPDIESVREELEMQIRQTTVQDTIENVTAEADVDRTPSAAIDPALIKNIEWLD